MCPSQRVRPSHPIPSHPCLSRLPAPAQRDLTKIFIPISLSDYFPGTWTIQPDGARVLHLLPLAPSLPPQTPALPPPRWRKAKGRQSCALRCCCCSSQACRSHTALPPVLTAGTVKTAYSFGGTFITFKGNRPSSITDFTLLTRVLPTAAGSRRVPVTSVEGISPGDHVRIFITDSSTPSAPAAVWAACGMAQLTAGSCGEQCASSPAKRAAGVSLRVTPPCFATRCPAAGGRRKMQAARPGRKLQAAAATSSAAVVAAAAATPGVYTYGNITLISKPVPDCECATRPALSAACHA